jgi:hypothetical protein
MAGLSSVFGQEKEVELKNKRITIQMDKKPLFDVFIQLIYKYDVAIGFEQSTLDSDHNDYFFQTNIPYDEINTPIPDGRKRPLSGGWQPIKNHLLTVDFKDARLEDVMNDIVKRMENYAWEINNDVINVYPIRGRDPMFEKLLDIKVKKFSIKKGAEVRMIQPEIVLNLPEFRAFLAENNLHSESLRVAAWYLGRPLPEGMEFYNLRFKELLNAITKSKRGGWILKRKTPNKTPTPNKPPDKDFVEILI